MANIKLPMSAAFVFMDLSLLIPKSRNEFLIESACWTKDILKTNLSLDGTYVNTYTLSDQFFWVYFDRDIQQYLYKQARLATMLEF